MTDTIFARASGAGKAGVAVFRVSGPLAHSISAQLVGKQIKIREAHLARLHDPKDGSLIDQGLVIVFKGPESFTGEDVTEFHLHGARAVETALYTALNSVGARPAQAGEFTLRAMKNGKLDLAQVEALADLIDSETSEQKKQALGQYGGQLSALATGWRGQILAVMAPLEADIDFPDEEDIPEAIAAAAGPALAELKTSLTMFLNQSGRARMIREGVSIAIIGPPNAGKSSLINALAGSDIAIVSEIAGTTRDIVEVRLDLGGVVATIADTAGLRGGSETDDVIEKEGITRARARAEIADIRVAVLDPLAADISTGTLELLKAGDFLVWSMADKAPTIPAGMTPEGTRAIELSGKTGQGVEAFLDVLTKVVAGKGDESGPALTRARHVSAVEQAIEALSRAEDHMATAPELAAEDARMAARALGSITGIVGVEDVLGEIFSSFCIGK